ncbi:MAG: polymer-forming cytoskeletal protein [Vicinamibacterales bacterium]
MADAPDAPGNIVIGEGVEARGTFVVPGRAVLNGTLEGTLVAKDLFVGRTGKGVGKFRAESADIHGQIHDTLVTTGSLVIRSTGRIAGVVYYREVEIEKSGQIEGKMAQGDAPASAMEPQAPPATEKAAPESKPAGA